MPWYLLIFFLAFCSANFDIDGVLIMLFDGLYRSLIDFLLLRTANGEIGVVGLLSGLFVSSLKPIVGSKSCIRL